MGQSLHPLLKAINEVNDNLWLGDYERAIEIATVGLSEKKEFVGAISSASKAKKLLKDKRKEGRQKEKGTTRRLWVATEVANAIEKERLDPVQNITGVLFDQLSDIKDMLVFFAEAESHEKYDNIDETAKKREISYGKGYRFSIQRIANKWDVRALLDKPYSQEKESKRLDFGQNNYSVSEKHYAKSGTYFDMFSNDSYCQLTINGNQVTLTIFSVSDDIKPIVNNILQRFASGA
jgi:hypothetical protein